MESYCLSHLSDPALVRDLTALVARDRATTAALLAHLAEVDERKLYLPDAQPSMYSWCVGVLGFSEESAHKRIRVARVARRFPAIFQAIADGSLNLIAPYLTSESAGELIQAARGRKRAEVEELLARRFPRSESLPMVVAITGAAAGPGEDQRSPGTVQVSTPLSGCHHGGQSGAASEGPKVSPIAEERYELRLSVGKETIETLRYAQALMSHTLPAGAVDQVIALALKSLVRELERRKFAATSRPRQAPGRASDDPRHIPAAVKRAVRERDLGRCTFVSERGERCPAHSMLEFDHADPVARGGRASVGNLRLRCRAHNQYAAERVFGAGFMKENRERSQAAARGRVAEDTRAAEAIARTDARRAAEEVIPWLRQLGFRADESRVAAAHIRARHPARAHARVGHPATARA